MASISATFSGDGGVSELEAAFREASRELLKQCAAKQVKNIKARVKNRQSVSGGTYKASLRAVAEGGTTLLDTGAMLKSLKASNFSDKSADVGFSSTAEVQKAVYHHYGTRRGLPKRHFFGFSDSDLDSIDELAAKVFCKVLAQKGLRRG